MKYILFFLIFLLSSFALVAQEPILIDGSKFEYSFDKENLEFWSERQLLSSQKQLIADYFLSNPPAPQAFEKMTYDDQIIWVKTKIKTEKNFFPSKWLLSMQPSDAFFQVDIFDENGKALYRDLKADTLENAQVKLPLEANRLYTVVIHCARSNFISFKLTDWAYREGQLQTKEFDTGLFFGALGVLLIYNLFIFISVREISFIFYSIYLGGMITCLGIIGGIFPLNQMLTTIGLFTTVGFLLFTHSLLELRYRFPRIGSSFYVFASAGGILAVLAAFPAYLPFIGLVEYLGDLFIFSSFALMIGFAVYLSIRKQKSALLYVIAWSPLFFAMAFYFSRVHLLKGDSGYWELFAWRSAVLAQTLIFTAGFTYRVKHLQIENAIQTEKAKDAERLRNLVRVICHDIANPLTVIQAYSSFNKDEDSTWAMVNKASDKICDLVSRIKTLQALESKKQKMTQSPVFVERFITAIHDTFILKFKEKEITFNVDASPEIRQKRIMVDPVLFESTVMNNLISNAVKFSYAKSSIWLRVTEENKKIVFELEDHGMGIPKKLLSKIFSPNEKTSRPGTQGEKGTGFGMPLIKGLLEGMDGELTVESESLEDNQELEHGRTVFKVYVMKA